MKEEEGREGGNWETVLSGTMEYVGKSGLRPRLAGGKAVVEKEHRVGWNGARD